MHKLVKHTTLKKLSQRAQFKPGSVYYVDGYKLQDEFSKCHQSVENTKSFIHPVIGSVILVPGWTAKNKYWKLCQWLITSKSLYSLPGFSKESRFALGTDIDSLKFSTYTLEFVNGVPPDLTNPWELRDSDGKRIYLGIFKKFGNIECGTHTRSKPVMDPYYYLLPLFTKEYHLTEYSSAPKRAKKGYVYDFEGKLVKTENAVKILNEWYEKNVSAVEVDDKWCIYDKNNILKDELTGKWGYKQFMTKGIISMVDSSPVEGWFKLRFYSNGEPATVIGCIRDAIFKIRDKELALSFGFKEITQHGQFGYYNNKTQLEHVTSILRNNFGNSMHQFNHNKKKVVPGVRVGLDVRKKIGAYNRKYGMASTTNIIAEQKDYTFGVELETSSGVLNSYVYGDRLNLKCVRDGSVMGGEYVTGVLFGDHGFHHLRQICDELAARCTIDSRCGVHVHIGNVQFTKELSINLSILGEMIQDELFCIFPASRRSNRYCSFVENERWCSPEMFRRYASAELDKTNYKELIHEMYEHLYKYLSLGDSLTKETNRRTKHKGGHYGGGHGTARYNWLNLITANFVQRESGMTTSNIDVTEEASVPSLRPQDELRTRVLSKPLKELNIKDLLTVEFRCHSATLNFSKIRNWILICMGIVSFAEDRQFLLRKALREGTTLTLDEIVKSVYSSKTAEKLIAYIQSRKNAFKSLNPEDEDATFVVKVPSLEENSLSKTINSL